MIQAKKSGSYHGFDVMSHCDATLLLFARILSVVIPGSTSCPGPYVQRSVIHIIDLYAVGLLNAQEKTEMHRVLLIQEVIHRIMEHLSPRNPAVLIPKRTRATLLNVALTCRLFLGPALDALWYSIDDLMVLFKLLPNFLSSDIGGSMVRHGNYIFLISLFNLL